MKTLYEITGDIKDVNTLLISRADNIMLRRLLCLSYAKRPYLDDGELQDCEHNPCIDFLRDSPDEIYTKMVARMHRECQS